MVIGCYYIFHVWRWWWWHTRYIMLSWLWCFWYVRWSSVNFNASGDFIPDQDYTRSFNCKSNESVTLEPVDKKIYPANITLYISNFTVQAFHFNKNGTFGRREEMMFSLCFKFYCSVLAYQCSADSSGNKIVPIAVGAALAGLIVIVLIAFVAGRLINRKKNTYEPLS